MNQLMPNSRVLSIQSHVVHGYVGNKCAVLPLNRLGMDVDAIHTVEFSNHTGYPNFNGKVLDGDGLLQLIDGLESNGLLNYTHLLTGYIGSLSLLETIAEVVERLRKINPNLIYGKPHLRRKAENFNVPLAHLIYYPFFPLITRCVPFNSICSM